MVKILLIGPSNTLFMPYVSNYIKILQDHNIETYLICWDRLNIETFESNKFIYKDKNVGHNRGITDYLKFAKFISGVISKNKFDKIIVFGIQLTFFLQKQLRKRRENYIIDIRDHHKLYNFMNFKKIVDNSYLVTLSSSAYQEWLPPSTKYIVSHNLNHEGFYEGIKKENLLSKAKICIGYIGSITHFDENKMLINSLKNHSKYLLTYDGAGNTNAKIATYLKEHRIENVILNGKYAKEDEIALYQKLDFVNLLLNSNDLNNRTCMANRFYNAVIFGRPLLIFEGSYMAILVEKYSLGLVISSLENIDEQIEQFIEKFSEENFNNGRTMFYKEVLKDKVVFEKKLVLFFEK